MENTSNEVVVNSTSEIELYDHEKVIGLILQEIETIRRRNAEGYIRIGKWLLLMKDNVSHGEWLESLDRLGLELKSTQRLMKMASVFGDDPGLLENMSKTKAYLLATLPEENLVQLKTEKVLTDIEGNVYTIGEIQEWTKRETEGQLINLRNQKNKEIADWKDRAQTSQQEMDVMRTQYDENERFMRELMENKDAAFAGKVTVLESRLKELADENNTLIVKMREKEAAEATGEDARMAITEAKHAMSMIMIKFATIKLAADRELAADYYGFIRWSEETITTLRLRDEAAEEMAVDG